MSANTFTFSLPSSVSTLRRTGALEIDTQVLDEVDQGVVDLEWPAADHHRSLHAHRLEAGVAVAELGVETPRCEIVDARAEADPAVASGLGRALGRERHGRAEAFASSVFADEHVLDLRIAEHRLVPGDVCVCNRLAVVPGDEIRPVAAEAGERQPVADAADVAVRQLADVDEATSRRRKVRAPSLSSISFRLPHFGLWTQDGQPSLHGQPSSIRAVS